MRCRVLAVLAVLALSGLASIGPPVADEITGTASEIDGDTIVYVLRKDMPCSI